MALIKPLSYIRTSIKEQEHFTKYIKGSPITKITVEQYLKEKQSIPLKKEVS